MTGVNRKPNIIVIMSDDQGAWAMGCAGNSEIKTPNLDRLAASGIQFTDFFCVSPVCSPARASFLTGNIPSRHGVHDWIRSGNLDKDRLSPELAGNNNFKDEMKPIEYLKGITAYTEILAASGYTCGLSGKWHLGDSVKPQKGFSHWFTIARGGCSYVRPEIVHDGEVQIGEGYITDIITDDALDYLDECRSSDIPFYLGVNYTSPHSPWDRSNHPAEYFTIYEDCLFKSCPEEIPHPWQINTAPCGTGDKRKELLKGYYAAITAMDRGIGCIIDRVENLGLRNNTLIVFTSDNGMNMGHHGIWGKGNGTFPQNMFDTSVKVPFLASLPGIIPQGVKCNELLSHYDFMPTILDFLGLSGPISEELPGKSFAPVLRGQDMQKRDSVVVMDEYGPVRMIRNREWKYVHRFPYGPNELYNLLDDPEERINLVADESRKGIVENMRADLLKWFIRFTDPSVDGIRENVTGKGQIYLAGTGSKGMEAYMQDMYFINPE